ncbi:hypothetical protein ES692_15545 [Psychroserpens burtonensis]|uniref:Uncharacterized protein n=2 Tax=Psychroserpens burtonensis TaxID=49278 RepID=A0A5C7B333_9FLAO|nr:hypothetical protein ES692_15545 [Psychroserpens burtonensis]
MIKFFRHIRKDLMEKNKTGTYVKYAIGEIVLVVIGILIALSISNWNENQKDKETEFYVLEEILNNLKEDALLIEGIIAKREDANTSAKNMLGYLKQDTVDVDVLSRDFLNYLSFERYFPINNAYEILKSKGLKLSNNKLTTRISRYYDYEQNKVNFSIKDVEDAILIILNDKNSIIRFVNTFNLNEYVELTEPNSTTFKNELYRELVSFKNNNGGTLERLRNFSNTNSALVSDLEQELKKNE